MSDQAAVRRQARADAVKSLDAGVSPAFLRDQAATLARRGEIDRSEGIREALKERQRGKSAR